MRRTSIFAMAAIALSMAPGAALSQDVKRYAPSAPTSDRPIEIKGPAVAAGNADTTPLARSLRGIVIVGKPGLVAKKGTSASGVIVRDNTVVVPPGALTAASAYIGKPLSLKSIGDLSRDLVLAYRDADLPVVNVAAPEQDISNGVLQLIVVVGHLGEVSVSGNRYFPADAYASKFTTEHGRVLDASKIVEDLRFMNRNPFRRVDAVYAPGSGFGLTNVELRPTEYRPFMVYAGYNNDGNDTLGRDRFNAGFMIGNSLGFDEVFGYQITTNRNFSGLLAHTATLQLPLPKRSELQFVGTYVTSNADLNVDTKTGGLSKMLGAYYVTQLPRFAGFAHDFKIGAEYKSTNNNLEFGGTTVTNNTAEIGQLVVGWSGERVSEYGHTRANINTYLSPGNVFGENYDAAFNAQRSGATANYMYARAGFDHRVDFSNDWRVLFSLAGQLANANLLASESFTLGGVGSVRGFQSNLTRADNGFTANLTVYTPGIAIGGPFQRRDVIGEALYKGKTFQETVHDQLRGFAFADYGWGRNHAKLPNETDISLAGIGVGLAYEMGRHMSAEIAYGWQVHEKGVSDLSNGYLHARLTKRF